MALLEQLQEAQKDAMRAKDKLRLSTIRMALAEVKQRQIDHQMQPDDANILAILTKMAKQRKESATQYTAGGRADLAEIELSEITIIEQFLPQIFNLITQNSQPATSHKTPLPSKQKKPIKTTKAENISNDPKLWLIRKQANPNAHIRLFCFPYAGGGASVFQNWLNYCPKQVELWAIQLPGRETRLQETAITSLKSLINRLIPILTPYLDQPYAFFGHSMGSLISFELIPPKRGGDLTDVLAVLDELV